MLLLLFFVVAVGAVRAEAFASYRAQRYSVLLMTDKCSGQKGGISRLAFKKRVARRVVDGCWWINRRDNPMVAWSGGRVQELQASRVRLVPQYAAALEPTRATALADAKAGASRASRPAGPNARTRPEKTLVAAQRGCKAVPGRIERLRADRARACRQTVASR